MWGEEVDRGGSSCGGGRVIAGLVVVIAVGLFVGAARWLWALSLLDDPVVREPRRHVVVADVVVADVRPFDWEVDG